MNVPPEFTRLVLPPTVPVKMIVLSVGAVGAAGMPRAAMVAAAGGSKKSGKLGSARLTPPWMLVSCPGLPLLTATAS